MVKQLTKQTINIALKAMLGSDDLVTRWWTIPNKAFNNKKPDDVWEYDPKAVASYVIGHLQR